MIETTEGVDTRQLIVDAAILCFRQVGLRGTTIVELANVAGVSRATIYSYFKDKAAIVEAVAESTSQDFYRKMLDAMSGETTLEGRLTSAAIFVTRSRAELEETKEFDEEETSILLTKNATALLLECSEFFAAIIGAARVTGEVRRDLDVAEASEWFARMLFSLMTTASPTLDLRDPEVVRRFVSDHVVRGFISYPQRAR